MWWNCTVDGLVSLALFSFLFFLLRSWVTTACILRIFFLWFSFEHLDWHTWIGLLEPMGAFGVTDMDGISTAYLFVFPLYLSLSLLIYRNLHVSAYRSIE